MCSTISPSAGCPKGMAATMICWQRPWKPQSAGPEHLRIWPRGSGEVSSGGDSASDLGQGSSAAAMDRTGVQPQSGSGYTVKAVSRSHGPSERLTVDLSDLDQIHAEPGDRRSGEFSQPVLHGPVEGLVRRLHVQAALFGEGGCGGKRHELVLARAFSFSSALSFTTFTSGSHSRIEARASANSS